MTDLAILAEQINELKADYADLKSKLSARVALYGAPQDFADRLVEHINQYGVDHGLTTLRKNPQLFGLDAAQGSRIADDIAKAAYDLADKATRYDELVLEREAQLRSADPARKPVMVMDGREFTFDVDAGTFTYLDEPGETHALHLEHVVPVSDGPVPDPQRRRTRSR